MASNPFDLYNFSSGGGEGPATPAWGKTDAYSRGGNVLDALSRVAMGGSNLAGKYKQRAQEEAFKRALIQEGMGSGALDDPMAQSLGWKAGEKGTPGESYAVPNSGDAVDKPSFIPSLESNTQIPYNNKQTAPVPYEVGDTGGTYGVKGYTPDIPENMPRAKAFQKMSNEQIQYFTGKKEKDTADLAKRLSSGGDDMLRAALAINTAYGTSTGQERDELAKLLPRALEIISSRMGDKGAGAAAIKVFNENQF